MLVAILSMIVTPVTCRAEGRGHPQVEHSICVWLCEMERGGQLCGGCQTFAQTVGKRSVTLLTGSKSSELSRLLHKVSSS